MTITNFNDLLTAALAQSVPQRLLFLFTRAELPADATDQQRCDFEAGSSGCLTPLMSVDKAPADLLSFSNLAAEADQMSKDWDIVFVGALQNTRGNSISVSMVEEAMNHMTEAVNLGKTDGLIPFNRHGEAVDLR
jgi:hypothetical protein